MNASSPGSEVQMRALLDALGAQDTVAVFVDDSTLRASQVSSLPADCDTWTAIAFAPGAYNAFHERVRHGMCALIEQGLEVHAHEIVQAPTGSPWRLRTLTGRREVLQEYATLLLDGVSSVYFLASRHDICDEALPTLNASAPRGDWANLKDRKEGGWYFALTLLMLRLRTDFPGSRFAVVADSGRFDNQLHSFLEPGSAFFGDGVVYIDSKALPGPQFADLAAYAHTRNAKRYQRQLDGLPEGKFDDILGRIVAGLKSRRVDLSVLNEVFAVASPEVAQC